MRRAAFWIAACLAAAGPVLAAPVTQAPAPVSRDDEGMQAWIDANIDLGDYVYVDADADQAYFLTVAATNDPASPLLRLMRRREFYAPRASRLGFRYRSATNLIEFDCAHTRQRVLTTQAYEFSNLQGARRDVDEQEPKWLYPREGSIAESELFLVCDALPASPPAPSPQPKGLLK